MGLDRSIGCQSGCEKVLSMMRTAHLVSKRTRKYHYTNTITNTERVHIGKHVARRFNVAELNHQ